MKFGYDEGAARLAVLLQMWDMCNSASSHILVPREIAQHPLVRGWVVGLCRRVEHGSALFVQLNARRTAVVNRAYVWYRLRDVDLDIAPGSVCEKPSVAVIFALDDMVGQ